MKRLRQIALQQEFLRAFDEPRVIEALHLTPAQRELIRAKQDEATLAIINLWPNDLKESRKLWEETWRAGDRPDRRVADPRANGRLARPGRQAVRRRVAVPAAGRLPAATLALRGCDRGPLWTLNRSDCQLRCDE